jgi:5'-phosphate synthase pdxT subunit
VAARNAYGTQVDSFAGPVEEGAWAGMPCIFIRAPRLEQVGDGVEVLAWLGGAPVAVRQGNVWATTFHPELTDDPRVHRALVDAAAALC